MTIDLRKALPPEVVSRLQTLPETGSPLRHIMTQVYGGDYKPLESLTEAQQVSDGVVVFEGDYGGQIYLTARASQVKCSEADLQKLLVAIDDVEWQTPSGRGVFYERLPADSKINGGMGGGYVIDGIWVHEHLASREKIIRAVLQGKLPVAKADLRNQPNGLAATLRRFFGLKTPL